ncbi:DUF1295 domain-containing protein [Kordiimonas aquimaris]|uniref:DUF1295 domain-containing protein n=1 Tax=Kordiimonas aquimaris TaxID=707591 RepID=UPI0021CEF023|nr:DUF1295 domain-containing protein [Kordiimonas aquimaris]
MKKKHFIDSHKVATAFAVLGMMFWTGNLDNTTAWVYFGLHGAYGMLWMLKSTLFGDRQWDQPTSLWYGIVIWIALTGYWIAPYLILTTDFEVPAWFLGAAIFVFTIGVFFHFTADMQKHISLKLKPDHLIQEGVWGRTRNPNYFGELLIYLGFTCLAWHWLPVLWLTVMIAAEWIPNMIKKDKSLSRYEGFAAYKKRSKLIIPFIL